MQCATCCIRALFFHTSNFQSFSSSIKSSNLILLKKHTQRGNLSFPLASKSPEKQETHQIRVTLLYYFPLCFKIFILFRFSLFLSVLIQLFKVIHYTARVSIKNGSSSEMFWERVYEPWETGQICLRRTHFIGLISDARNRNPHNMISCVF